MRNLLSTAVWTTSKARPLFLLLGARNTPTGPDRLLDCLRALAMAEKPPVHEVEKWYRRLDQMIDTCSTEDLAKIKKALDEEKIVLTEGVVWTTLPGVFLCSDEEDVPGAEVVRASVRDLALWRKLGIAERPTVELAIRWLNQLPSAETLSQSDLRRVRALLPRHASRIWYECGHWLNLSSEWAPVNSLSYALTMQALVPWSHLHEGVKQKTADLQRLSVEITEAPPFSRSAQSCQPYRGTFPTESIVYGPSTEASMAEPTRCGAWADRAGEPSRNRSYPRTRR